MPPRPTTLEKRSRRPRVSVVAEGPSEVTCQGYRQQVHRFERFLARISGCKLADCYRVGAWQALTIWVLLCMQVGYDTGLLGAGDAANLLCGMKWMFIREVMTASYAALGVDSALRIPWRSYQHWRKVEPSEFRLPLPHQVVLGMAGGSLVLRDFHGIVLLAVIPLSAAFRRGARFPLGTHPMDVGKIPVLCASTAPKSKPHLCSMYSSSARSCCAFAEHSKQVPRLLTESFRSTSGDFIPGGLDFSARCFWKRTFCKAFYRGQGLLTWWSPCRRSYARLLKLQNIGRLQWREVGGESCRLLSTISNWASTT